MSVEPCVIEVDGPLDPDCGLPELGSTVRFVERQPEPQPEPEPVMSATPAPAPEVPETPVAPPATTESIGVADDIAAVTDAVGDMGLGPSSPIVIIALAAIVVLFGSKGWSFWLQRSAQNHKLAMKQMEMEAAEQALAAKGAETSSPKACRLVHQELKTEVAALKTEGSERASRISESERRLLPLTGLDVDDLERRLKKLTGHASDAEEDVERLTRRIRELEDSGE